MSLIPVIWTGVATTASPSLSRANGGGDGPARDPARSSLAAAAVSPRNASTRTLQGHEQLIFITKRNAATRDDAVRGKGCPPAKGSFGRDWSSFSVRSGYPIGLTVWHETDCATTGYGCRESGCGKVPYGVDPCRYGDAGSRAGCPRGGTAGPCRRRRPHRPRGGWPQFRFQAPSDIWTDPRLPRIP